MLQPYDASIEQCTAKYKLIRLLSQLSNLYRKFQQQQKQNDVKMANSSVK